MRGAADEYAALSSAWDAAGVDEDSRTRAAGLLRERNAIDGN
jgi:hypothetical protein